MFTQQSIRALSAGEQQLEMMTQRELSLYEFLLVVLDVGAMEMETNAGRVTGIIVYVVCPIS